MRKKLTNIYVEFHHFTEAATGSVLQKRKFCNIRRKTLVLESLCGPSSLKFYEKETPTLMFPCEYYEIFKNTYFIERLQTTTASYFMKQNRHTQMKTKQLK